MFSYPQAGEELAASLMTQYLCRVLVREQISVSRLVGYIMTRTILGETETAASYTDLESALNLSRAGVRDALKVALAKGYIVQVSEGSNGHIKAVYALAWSEEEESYESEPIPQGRGDLTPTSITPEEEEYYENEAIPENSYQVQNTNQFINQTGSNLESSIIESIESCRIESLEHEPKPVQKPNQSGKANQSKKPLPDYLENLNEMLSKELGDLQHQRSNRTQVYNLFTQSGLTEKEFAATMYQARELTRRYAVLRPGEKLPSDGQPRNRMAYFFTVLRNKLFGRPDEPRQPSYNDQHQPKPTYDQHQQYKPGRMPTGWPSYSTSY